ncbi:Asp-tRNA(Asn)/Glu-tRNA(Gln) amidotransferase subunit GatC [Candidatus Woesearchaeota archaeon]|nr:Asp-tRNA(Asn)/Glu-tRNA(Gln) amidotransferase subunit GatC [Candidatus Woesearchaeota archaeon]
MVERIASEVEMISEQTLRQVAANSRLVLSDEEVKAFLVQLQEILGFFESIKNVRADVPASFIPVSLSREPADDVARECLSQQEALSNTQSKNGYIKGPKSI